MAIITVVDETGTLHQFDTESQRVVPTPEPERKQCHCEREPAKLWLCCLAPASTCPCNHRIPR